MDWIDRKMTGLENSAKKLGRATQRNLSTTVDLIGDSISPDPVLPVSKQDTFKASSRKKTGESIVTRARHLKDAQLLEKEVSAARKSSRLTGSAGGRAVAGVLSAKIMDPHSASVNAFGAGSDFLRVVNQDTRLSAYSAQRKRRGLPDPNKDLYYDDEKVKGFKTGVKKQFVSDFSPWGIMKNIAGHEAVDAYHETHPTVPAAAQYSSPQWATNQYGESAPQWATDQYGNPRQ